MLKDEELRNDGSLGIFTAVALVLLFWGFCWFKSYSPLGVQQHVRVIFPKTAGLNENADVFADGVRIGCVEKINWLQEGKVLVGLRIIHPKIVIRQGARFDILTNGLVGAKYVDVTLPESIDSPPLDESITVVGEKPVLNEIVISKLADELSKLDIDRIRRDLTNDRRILKGAVDKFSILADKTMPVMDRALPLESEISSLTVSLRRTSAKLDRLLSAEHISPELKETLRQANETARSAQAAIHELNITLGDGKLREDLLSAMNQFNQSTDHLQNSMKMLREFSGDEELRADTKQMLRDARIAMEKLDEVFSNPTFGSDLKTTLQKTRAAVQNIDLVAQQLNQILNKRHPLIHMLFGRPGYIKTESSEIHGTLPDADLSK